MTASTQGRANRRRGADAERAVVAWLRANGYPDARRYLAGDGRQPGDIDAIPGLVIEVKDCAASAWPTWCKQAIDAATGRDMWVVVRRARGVRDVDDWECRHGFSVPPASIGSWTFGAFIRWFADEAAPLTPIGETDA